MPFQIIQNDIVNMRVDAIVNTTNPSPNVGYGVDTAIHKKAGPALLIARKLLGTIPVGGAGITKGYRLPAKHVIHTVCPVWQGGEKGEEQLLQHTYDSCLHTAAKAGCESVAFPLMSAGNHGFPKQIALQTAVNAISRFLMDHDMMVYLVVFSRDAVQLSEKLLGSVESYIDEHYIRQKKLEEYGFGDKCNVRDAQIRETMEHQRRRRMAVAREYEETLECQAAPAPMAAKPLPKDAAGAAFSMDDLHHILEHLDAGFSETLLQLIDRSGKKDSEIYKRANIDRKLFSKIRKDPNYRPTKPTALAFAIALELDLEETEMLLSRAGLSLSHANKFDVVVEYFIKTKNYDIFELNEVLFAFDLTPIGGKI